MKIYGVINCSMCGKETEKTSTGNQKYCPPCREVAEFERKKAFRLKNQPKREPKITYTHCSACDQLFSAMFEGVPYCNKHYLRMYTNGTLEKVGRKKNAYTIEDGVVTMLTNKGEPFLIDEIDLDKFRNSTWCFNKSGRYLVANINKKIFRLHRMIMDVDNPNVVVDHINGDPSDNRRSNLRITTQKHNSRNVRASKLNAVKYPGVDKRPSGKHRARITFNRKEILIGTFDTVEEAIRERKIAEEKYYGEYSPSKGVYK